MNVLWRTHQHLSLTVALHCVSPVIREGGMSADVIRLSEFRGDDSAVEKIDLVTAIDVAIRDLREVLLFWGSDRARERAQECADMLQDAMDHHRRLTHDPMV
jgi:hypothetical protein